MLNKDTLLEIVRNPSALHQHIVEFGAMCSEKAQIEMSPGVCRQSNPKWQHLSKEIDNSKMIWACYFDLALKIIVIDKNEDSLKLLKTYPISKFLFEQAKKEPLYILAKQDNIYMFMALVPSLRIGSQDVYSELLSEAGERVKTYLENHKRFAKYRTQAQKVSEISFLSENKEKPARDVKTPASEETRSFS